MNGVLMRFEIDRVNVRRMQRSVDGVSISIFEDEALVGCPWMSAKDLRANIAIFGRCQAFVLGLACYKHCRDVRNDPATLTGTVAQDVLSDRKLDRNRARSKQ